MSVSRSRCLISKDVITLDEDTTLTCFLSMSCRFFSPVVPVVVNSFSGRNLKSYPPGLPGFLVLSLKRLYKTMAISLA